MTLAFTSNVSAVCRPVTSTAAPATNALRPRTARAAVLRRKRTTAVDEAGAGEGKRGTGDEQQKTPSPEDAGASDLALPDLRALFDGAGDPNCVQCAGRGEAVCVVCNAAGFITVTMMDTVSSSQCRLCRGKKSIPCPTCRKEVYKSVLWWDLIPTKEEDPDEKWREGPDGEPRIPWGENPAK